MLVPALFQNKSAYDWLFGLSSFFLFCIFFSFPCILSVGGIRMNTKKSASFRAFGIGMLLGGSVAAVLLAAFYLIVIIH